ncbi:chaperone modulator CbpM [Dinghuibacter silviterrae]|uniref:MerR-like DNA binding protein n=1 Tax=Dinghuibacter silviterrae TaxID=1539049 RepID=A0A4V3GLX4_9BACT|nr:chaperone modulator CbpM [Dinghuibacter silviterrae]TDX01293.1 MerR-like DNA binding protein [Dinghuibacter silviterrae]
MDQQEWIPAEVFCTHHHIELSLVQAIGDYGLVDISLSEGQVLISTDGLADLERVLRLYGDLGINLEGIEAISFLLERVRSLQHEVRILKARLKAYE